MSKPDTVRLNGASVRFKMGAYALLLLETFKASAQEYFSIKSRGVMKIVGTVMEAAVFGFIGLAMGHIMNLGTGPATSGPQFVLSGVIMGKLVGLGQIIQPFFFRGNYTSYHNTPFNTYFMCFVKNFDINYFFRIVELAIYLSVAWVFFDLKLNLVSPGFLLVIAFGVVFQLGLNLFANGWMVVTKHGGDPINWFYDSTRRLFSGELFPTTLLPGFLVFVSRAHPQTYVNTLARRVGIGHESLASLGEDCLVLVILSSLFLTLGCLMLRYGLADAKRKGTLKW